MSFSKIGGFDKPIGSVSSHPSVNKASSNDKLVSSLIQFSENLELHKIYVICLILKDELSNKQIEHKSIKRLFYYIVKCL